MSKIAIISDKLPEICDKLKEFDYKLIYTECVDGFISYEKFHADMQCITIDDTVIVLNRCEKLYSQLKNEGINIIKSLEPINGTYPHNIKLNAKVVGNRLLGKIDFLDSKLKELCINKCYSLINVNQGYSACSILSINNNSIITADKSIQRALKDSSIDVLKIREGHIKLHSADNDTCGFIGGASCMIDDNNVLFFGDISMHPDYEIIRKFCFDRCVNVHYIKKIPLTDIGGAVLLNY